MTEPSTIVLDTHVWIWLASGEQTLSKDARQCIERCATSGTILIPAISVWEIAKMVKKGRITLGKPCTEWVRQALLFRSFAIAPMTEEIALDSCFLPGSFHEDPADQIIVATARVEHAVLVTRDAKILRYAKEGFVDAIAA